MPIYCQILLDQETDQIMVVTVLVGGGVVQSRGRGGHTTESACLFCSVAVSTKQPVNKQTSLLHAPTPHIVRGMCSPVKGVNFINGQGVRRTWIAF